jgi:hypothetical protein
LYDYPSATDSLSRLAPFKGDGPLAWLAMTRVKPFCKYGLQATGFFTPRTSCDRRLQERTTVLMKVVNCTSFLPLRYFDGTPEVFFILFHMFPQRVLEHMESMLLFSLYSELSDTYISYKYNCNRVLGHVPCSKIRETFCVRIP